MRKFIFTHAAMACFFSFSYSQSIYVRKFPERYELRIPLEWNRPKLVKAITEILPKTLTPLKLKEFCTDCVAGYTVMLSIDSPYILSRNNISKGRLDKGTVYTMDVIYQFRAALSLYDSAGKNIYDLVLVLPEEQHSKKKDTVVYAVSRDYSSPTIIKDQQGRAISTVYIPMINLSLGPTNSLSPTIIELMNIAEQRVYAIRSVLKKED